MTPWSPVDDRQEGSFRVFDVVRRRRKSPASGREADFFVLEAPDWVNIIPVTPDGDVVFVRQYRAGTESVTLEVPGGTIDGRDETARAAGRREMEEETGYTSRDVIDLGTVAPNPAIQTNNCATVLARNVTRTGEQNLEGAEEIDVDLVPLDVVPSLIFDGTITHSLVVAAFYFLDHARRTEPDLLPL